MLRRSGLLAVALLGAVAVGCETLTVVAIEVSTLAIAPSSATIVEGEARDFQAIARGPEGRVLTGRPVQWSSDDPAVAAVTGLGRVSGSAPGETTIRASVGGVAATSRVEVLVGPSVLLSDGSADLAALEGMVSTSVNVDVLNGGNGTLSGLSATVEYGPLASGWMIVGLNGTTAPTTLTVRGSAVDLTEGVYTATVTVRSSAGAGSSTELQVRFVVTARPPTIAFETDVVGFAAVQNGQQAAVQAVAVTNGGGGTLDGMTTDIAYAEGQPVGWLVATLDGPVAPAQLTLRASPGGLAPGSYTASVLVSSPVAANSPATLTVVFTIAPAASPVDGVAGPAMGSDRRR